MQNFMGMDGFIWFTGVVEDRDDPSKLGRVRVRIVGHNTDDKSKIPTMLTRAVSLKRPINVFTMPGITCVKA